MPIPLLTNIYLYGAPAWMPEPRRLVQAAGALGVLAATKYYCGGTANRSERAMHGRVVLLTGGTSGVGAVVARELATRGAHVVLLTAQPPSDPLVVDYVEELRALAGHQLVYAEQCDLSSLHSIRAFATKWLDNLPVRRLDMVILCAAAEGVPVGADSTKKTTTTTAKGVVRGVTTEEGIERAWMVNYLANFHLLGLLSPALRAQPFDRDVRVLVTTCASYIGAPPLVAAADGPTTATTPKSKKKSAAAAAATSISLPDWSPKRAYARSKLALMVFARAYQKHLDAYKRPDGLPPNVRVLLVDPGLARTPGFRYWLTGRSLLTLLFVYVLFYPIWWLFIKSADEGAASLLYAAMDGSLRRLQDLGGGDVGGVGGDKGGGEGSSDSSGDPLRAAAAAARDPLAGKLVKECRLVDVARRDVDDEAVAQALWEASDQLVEETEKRAALARQQAQKAHEAEEAKRKEDEQASELAALVSSIKQGQAKEKAREKAKTKAQAQAPAGAQTTENRGPAEEDKATGNESNGGAPEKPKRGPRRKA
ncbi:short chain dehydrogenase reductase [Niveomyces insectorum RCEF 264]|uniref:Short chain dehydrogenase reductase n=1 Tax=Niveomyces insectorum RCEF 264 TaxID=1081102 RepID=A0A167WVW5_9HYPO|nr:short chain dehydrogenase reductase [Niveomyces insectorum RCEF 264]